MWTPLLAEWHAGLQFRGTNCEAGLLFGDAIIVRLDSSSSNTPETTAAVKEADSHTQNLDAPQRPTTCQLLAVYHPGPN